MPKGWKVRENSGSKVSSDAGPDINKRTENDAVYSREGSSDGSSNQSDEISRLEGFVPEAPKRSLEDLVVTPIVRSRIETALNQIQFHDVLYHEWNLQKIDPSGRRVAINLYGPPGTGKSFCSEAIAHHLGKKIIKVNYAEIESKYVGETPKNISAAFEKARVTDSVLFFDEADSILGKRLTNVTQSSDHGVNVSRSVMLIQLDNFDGVVVFASNLPGNYDGAFVRRILAHVEFEIPDLDCRIQLWNYLLPAEVPKDESITSQWLSEESEGLAGGDILSVVKLSASRAVARTGEHKKLSQLDILDSIDQVRSSKKSVGAFNNGRSPILKEQDVTLDELPPDARERYESVVSDLKS